jgi:hypothetical protein
VAELERDINLWSWQTDDSHAEHERVHGFMRPLDEQFVV